MRAGGGWFQQAKLTASDAAGGELFGSSVALDGDTAVVGANFDSDAGFASGSAYVFVRSSGAWSQQAKLTASAAAMGDQFGKSVSISGDTVVVGANGDDTAAGADAGSAYVFDLLADGDNDGIADVSDNCPSRANADQADKNADGRGDLCPLAMPWLQLLLLDD